MLALTRPEEDGRCPVGFLLSIAESFFYVSSCSECTGMLSARFSASGISHSFVSNMWSHTFPFYCCNYVVPPNLYQPQKSHGRVGQELA